MQWFKTKYPGIRYRQHATRKHGVQPDRYYVLTYKHEGKTRTEALGWSSEGMTLDKAVEAMAEIKTNRRTGTGPDTLAEKKQLALEAKQAAEAEKARIEAERLAAKQAEAEQIRLEQESRFDSVWKRYCESNGHKKSLKAEMIYASKWILPLLGKKLLSEIIPLDVERVKKAMIDNGKAPRSVQYCLAIVRQIFNFGKSQKLFDGNSPTRGVKIGKFDNGRIRFPSQYETDALLAELKKRSKQTWQMATISLHCGLRFSELANLRWQRVDTEQGHLTLTDTKNSKTRIAYMTEAVRGIFSDMVRGKNNELVFPDQYGNVMKRISPAFFRAIDHLGLNDNVDDPRMKLVFHSLRHAFGSRLIKSGADMAIVRDLLGHKDFTMLSRYTHSEEDSRREAVKAMESAMNQQNRQAEIIPMPKRAG